MKNDELLSTKDLSEWTKVPVATLYSWRRRGKGPAAIRVGKYLRYEAKAIVEWLESLRSAS